LMATLPALN